MTNPCIPGPPGPVVTAGTLTIRMLNGGRGLLLEGEADMNSHCALRRALSALQAGSQGDIHLELAGLRFIDVSCTRELVATTDREPATRLILHHPPIALQRITALAWPDADIEVASASI